MPNDYTLPPVPDLRKVPHDQLAACVVTYGHAVAAPLVEENARLLARVAELEATLSGKEAAWAILNRSIGHLRAEVEAYRADAERWKWRKENPTARLVFAGGFWRIENLNKWHPSADAAVDAAIAARKGSEAAQAQAKGE